MYESDAGPTATQISGQKHALLHEIACSAHAVRGLDFDGFYFGGGTPTIFMEPDFRDILSAVRHAFAFSGRGASTCEMHPYSATEDKMAIAVENGVDRISIGVQSLTPAVLQRAYRIPADTDRIRSLIELAVRCGARQTNIDLLAPLPGETLSSFVESVRGVLSCRPDSITLYNFQNARSSYFTGDAQLAQAAWPEIRNEFLRCVQAEHYNTTPGSENLVSSVIVSKDFCYYNYDNNYELFSKKPLSVLGIGKYAKSNIFGKLFYYNTGPDNGDTGNRYLGYAKTLQEEAMDMVLLHFRDRCALNLESFGAVFGFKPHDFIREHFGLLFEHGHLTMNATHVFSTLQFSDESQFLQFSELMKHNIKSKHPVRRAKGIKDPNA